MSHSKTQHDIGLDICRIVAFIFVPCVHFFLNSGFYEQPVCGWRMFLMVLLRTVFTICVPMFMLLTGYLMSDRDIDISPKPLVCYYKRLIPLYLSYVFASVLITLYQSAALNEPFAVKDAVKNILAYSQYSWYVKMYLGFALLIPFLNLIWKGIKSKSGAICLLAVLSVLTVLPSVFNVFDLKTPWTLIKPWLATSYTSVVPDWWTFLYPLTYYFFGAYLKRNVDIKSLKTRWLVLLFALSVLIFSAYNILYSYSKTFVWGVWQDYGSLQNTVNAILMFMILNSVRYPKPPRFVSSFFSYIASLTFTAYICSWITDDFLYSRLNKAVPVITDRLNYFPITVILSVAGSLIISAAVQPVVKVLTGLKIRK